MNTVRNFIYVIVPNIYVVGFHKNPPRNIVSIESLVTLSMAFDQSIITGKQVILDYCFVSAALAWAGQARLNARFYLKDQPFSTDEKAFQQSVAHSIFTSIVSNSMSAKRLQALYAVQVGINREFFAISEEERGSSEILLSFIQSDFEDILSRPGNGSLQNYVKDIDARRVRLRGLIASIRSTWCSVPTHSASSLISDKSSLKLFDEEKFYDYVDILAHHLMDRWKNGNAFGGELEKVTFIEIKDFIKSAYIEMKLPIMITEREFMANNSLPLDSIFNITRQDLNKPNVTSPIPDILNTLKSTNPPVDMKQKLEEYGQKRAAKIQELNEKYAKPKGKSRAKKKPDPKGHRNP